MGAESRPGQVRPFGLPNLSPDGVGGGNGPFTGEIQSNGDLSFTDNISDACCMATIITFVGMLHADGSMDGTYTTNANEQGTWQTTPN